jgi:transposase
MGLSRRHFTREFKLAAVRRLEMGASIAEVARAFEVNPNVLHHWRREFRDGPGNAFSGPGKRRWEESRVAQPERKIGQQTLKIDFLKGCLQRIEEQRQLQAITGSRCLPGNPNQRERAEALSLKRMCALAGVSRASLYRFRPARQNRIEIWSCGMPSNASPWSFLAMAGPA